MIKAPRWDWIGMPGIRCAEDEEDQAAENFCHSTIKQGTEDRDR